MSFKADKLLNALAGLIMFLGGGTILWAEQMRILAARWNAGNRMAALADVWPQYLLCEILGGVLVLAGILIVAASIAVRRRRLGEEREKSNKSVDSYFKSSNTTI